MQRNAAKFVCNSYNNYNVSSSELVLSLGWEALGVRRLYNQTVLFYKFYNGKFHVRFLTVNLAWVIPLFDATFAVYNNFSYSFFPRCIRMRNLLSSQVVSAFLQNQKSSRFTAVKNFYQFYVFYCTDGKLHFRTNITLLPRY